MRTKTELKELRNKRIVADYKKKLELEELAYIYNLSAQQVQTILKQHGIDAKVDSKKAKDLKAPKSKKKYTDTMFY